MISSVNQDYGIVSASGYGISFDNNLCHFYCTCKSFLLFIVHTGR